MDLSRNFWFFFDSILLMKKLRWGALFPCDNDNTAFANWNNWGYFRLRLSFNIVPTLLQYLSILKIFEGFKVTWGVPSHISQIHLTNMKVANVCFVMAHFHVSCKNATKFFPVDTNSTVNEPCHIYLHLVHAA